MIEIIVAILAFGAIAALLLWWGVRSDDEGRVSSHSRQDGGEDFPPFFIGPGSVHHATIDGGEGGGGGD